MAAIVPTITARFNTQPPEGGWLEKGYTFAAYGGFNTQPPEGGWEIPLNMVLIPVVSTHSRPKAAGDAGIARNRPCPRFNTQPPEGGWGYHAGQTCPV